MRPPLLLLLRELELLHLLKHHLLLLLQLPQHRLGIGTHAHRVGRNRFEPRRRTRRMRRARPRPRPRRFRATETRSRRLLRCGGARREPARAAALAAGRASPLVRRRRASRSRRERKRVVARRRASSRAETVEPPKKRLRLRVRVAASRRRAAPRLLRAHPGVLRETVAELRHVLLTLHAPPRGAPRGGVLLGERRARAPAQRRRRDRARGGASEMISRETSGFVLEPSRTLLRERPRARAFLERGLARVIAGATPRVA